jgi:hypothetical protein
VTDPISVLKGLTGGVAKRAKPGIGSFLNIDIVEGSSIASEVALWVYFANWALLKGEEEILASDNAPELYQTNKHLIQDLEGKFVTEVTIFPKREVHISFNGHVRLEIWSDQDVFLIDEPMIKIKSKGEYLVI